MEFLTAGFTAAFAPANLLALVAGSALGIIVGVLPGLGPMVGMVVLLPFTFGMEPSVALSLLLAVFCGGYFGGAIPAVLLRTPGVPSSIVTSFDGYPLTEKGEAQTALAATVVGSFVGGVVSVILLMALAPLLSGVAKSFGSPEYLLAAMLGLVLVIVANKDRLAQAVMLTGIGMWLATIGIDPSTLSPRFTFGSWEMQNGLDLVALVLGLFGIGQALLLLEQGLVKTDNLRMATKRLGLSHILRAFRYVRTLLSSSIIGTFIGLLPGTGTMLASYLSYDFTRRTSKDPDSFGKGNPEGCIAAEAANNAVPAGAMIPLLTLGIPGEAISALLLGIFTLNGIYPGPLLLEKEPELISTLYWSMLLINVVSFAMLALLLRPFAMVVRIPPAILSVCVITISLIGVYAVNTRLFDCGVALAAGLVGYFMLRAGWPVVALVMGIVIGPIIENRFRQSLSQGDGDITHIFTRPVSQVLLVIIAVLIVLPVIKSWRERPSGP